MGRLPDGSADRGASPVFCKERPCSHSQAARGPDLLTPPPSVPLGPPGGSAPKAPTAVPVAGHSWGPRAGRTVGRGEPMSVGARVCGEPHALVQAPSADPRTPMQGAAPLPPRGWVTPEGSPDQNPGLQVVQMQEPLAQSQDAPRKGAPIQLPPEHRLPAGHGLLHFPGCTGLLGRSAPPALTRPLLRTVLHLPVSGQRPGSHGGPPPAHGLAHGTAPGPRRSHSRRRPAGKPEAPVLPSPASARTGRPKPESGSGQVGQQSPAASTALGKTEESRVRGSPVGLDRPRTGLGAMGGCGGAVGGSTQRPQPPPIPAKVAGGRLLP
uniref:basic salivary proline-rich protein 1-like n=1 Tax=Nyctereutes procyonoides TaxID=34880 RepID=UPI00244440E9|nr:basic salivary proline-rich protein 1-like [Nyctereutes procyonoides]